MYLDHRSIPEICARDSDWGFHDWLPRSLPESAIGQMSFGIIVSVWLYPTPKYYWESTVAPSCCHTQALSISVAEYIVGRLATLILFACRRSKSLLSAPPKYTREGANRFRGFVDRKEHIHNRITHLSLRRRLQTHNQKIRHSQTEYIPFVTSLGFVGCEIYCHCKVTDWSISVGG